MSEAVQLRGGRWFGRRLLSTSDLGSWGPGNWEDWFSDGLRVWFSDWSDLDRAFAFAPLRINPDRDVMTEAVAKYLQRFYMQHPAQKAKAALDLADAIELGAVACMQSAVVISDCARAHFLLDIFEMLGARALPTLARLSIQVLRPVAFEGDDAEEYLSRLAYIIFDNNALRDDAPEAAMLEERLRQCDNFRPALFYSLQLTGNDLLLSLERYYDLRQEIDDIDDEDIWREVSEEFDRRFGRSAVVDAIRRASSDTLMEHILDIRGLEVAAHMRPHYPEIADGGLFAKVDRQRRYHMVGYDEREIEFGKAA